MSNVITIGAGPAGLIASIIAARNNNEVTIIDRANKPGKKLYATGNGKCNFTNHYIDDKVFRSSTPAFAYNAYEKFDNNALIEFFNEIGVLAKDNNGYVYPYSEQAASIVDALVFEAKRLNIKIITDEQVNDFEKCDGGFVVHGANKSFICEKLIIAVGGLAQPNLGSDGSLYKAIKKNGHSFTKTFPALCSLLYSDKELANLFGVRVKCSVYLNINQLPAEKESGEIIFNKDNISGIPVMQLSRYAAFSWSKKENVSLKLDFYDQYDEAELFSLLNKRLNGPYTGDKTISEALSGFMNNKLLNVVLKRAGINADKKAKAVKTSKISELVSVMKGFTVNVSKTNTYDNAQVMAGGIKLKEIKDTFESKILDGLYLAGEVLDVDGTCGGYNLQWAFTSGYLAGLLK